MITTKENTIPARSGILVYRHLLMYRITIFVSILLLLSGLSACRNNVNEPGAVHDPWPLGVMYEIFVQSFADSDNDGIGDIPGMTAKLDYLRDLGIQGVWLMPISPSPSYHKYDVTDYYGIHPDYGTLEDFKIFVEEAHKRNIRVVIDLVVNHSSSEHPWFQSAVSDSESSYRDYYVWANPDSIKEQIAKKSVTLDSDNITQWHPSSGNEDYYYGFFWGGMPDLNFDNPKVRSEIIAIGKYWLTEIGVDGFRLDAAKHIYPDDQAKDSHEWWIEFGNAMRAFDPDVYMVGEVWGDKELVGPYLQGLPSMFNFDFYHQLNKLIDKEQNESLIENLIAIREVYEQINSNYIDAIFLNNHDQNRLLSDVGGDNRKAKLAAAIFLTLPGMPYLYYGDEIGMLGQKPDEEIREPFLWDYSGLADEQTNWISSKNSNDSTVVPLKVQMKDEASIYGWYKKLIHLRNKESILREGDLKSLSLGVELLGYERALGDQSLLVIHNLTGIEHTVSLAHYPDLKFVLKSNKAIEIDGGQLMLSAYGSAILSR